MNVTHKYLRDLEGMTKDDAIDKIIADNLNYRITRDDNINYMITCDFDVERINLEIYSGIVTSASLG